MMENDGKMMENDGKIMKKSLKNDENIVNVSNTVFHSPENVLWG